MNFSNRTLGLLTAVLVLGAAGGGVYLKLNAGTGEAAGAGPGPAEESEGDPGATSAAEQFSTTVAQPVTGAPAVLDTLWITVRASGQAVASRQAAVTPRVEGRVVAVYVRENEPVRRGQRLLQIDTTEYALEVARARADVLDKQAAYQRLIAFDEELPPEERAERARLARTRSGLEQAEVSLRQAQLNLERTTVRAPFEGRVADLVAVPGQWVEATQEVLKVVDLDPIRVDVNVLEAELGGLTEGRHGTVTFAAFPGERFRGRVVSVNPLVDEQSRTGRVTLLLDNPDGRIKPGMFADVTLDAQAYPDRVLIPRAALLERDGRPMVFVYKPDGRYG
ncbi:MAG: efflux RND transporter periplasmic adaptor subunit, partial [Gemmatimonadetes bacterium]